MNLPSLSQCIQDYLEQLTNVRRLSPHTVSAYRRDLSAFEQYCEKQDALKISDVNESIVRQYSARLHQQGNNPKSIQRKLSSIRGLFNYFSLNVASSDSQRKNPALSVRAPKTSRKLPSAIDIDQMQHLLDTLKHNAVDANSSEKEQFFSARTYAILELLYASGMRLAEIASLDENSIDFKARDVTVTGKGSKQRVLPIGKQALAAIQLWLKAKEYAAKSNINDNTKPLFISQRGTRLSHRSIQLILRKEGLHLPHQQSLHPHKMRHSYASHLLESSQDLRAVQELLGHANLSTTQIYTHIDFQQLSNAYDKFHPKAKLDS